MEKRLSLNLNNRFSLNLDILLNAYDKAEISYGKLVKYKEDFKELAKETPEVEEKPVVKEEIPPVPYFYLYKYSTTLDKLLIFIAIIFCLVAAVASTVLSLTFGKATGSIVNYAYTIKLNGTNPVIVELANKALQEDILWFVGVTCGIGTAILVATYISTVMFNYSALRQTFKIREIFLQKILNQDIAWYDQNQTGDFASRVADDLKKIEEGIGEKVSIFIFYQAIFVSSIIQGLVKGWELALICMTSFPITTITMGCVAWVSSKLAKQEMDAYGEAGSVAEEALSSIRTVVAFGGQEKEEQRYNKLLLFARNNNIKRSVFNGISNALMWFFAYSSYSLAFWYGVKLILKERGKPPDEITYDAGNMITIFFSVLTGTWYFGMAAPYMETFGIAKGAAAKIFSVINSVPIINACKGKGKRPRRIDGTIKFSEVHFNYPSRKAVKILQGLNLTIKSGETVALVGSSGCGKSTCIQLIQRFYDPDSGNVYIDNNKITDLDLKWLRSYIGVVGQEPVLFETTISENIKYGYEDATQEEIENAAKKANAHTFITSLPQGYQTMIGERGAQLSGGQKQRIAIARALVREPAILLLDEATSALDTKSEAIVQAALDAVSHECTTVIVAHRLSTVRKADRIIVLANGQVQEDGSHDDLMKIKGAYYQLVTTQVAEPEDEDATQIDPDERIDMLRQKSIDGFGDKRPSLLGFGDKRPSLLGFGDKRPSLLGFGDKRPSLHAVDHDDFKQDAEETETSRTSLWAIMKYNMPEWWIIAIGCVSALVCGAAIPVYSIMFGDVIGVLAGEDEVQVQKDANKFAIYFLIIGSVSGVATLLQTYTFGVAGEKLTMRLRSLMFQSILNQEMGWFDVKEHGVGALCARLSGEAASVQGATGQRIGALLNAFSTIVIALATAFYFEWRLAFVALCFAPLIVLSIYLEQRIIAKESQGHYTSLQNSTKIAVEAINGIRTVASLGCEETFQNLYMAELYPYQNQAKRNTHFRGVVYGVSRSLMCFAYSAALYYGAMLVRDEGLDYAKVFIVSESLITSSWSLANALAFTPNFSKGLIAANRIFDLLHRTPKITNGSENIHEKWDKGNLNYKSVFFSYPTRPSIGVLRGLNLSVLKGKMVALVGPSGCGKSTIVQLLERFYDPSAGEITSDDRPIDKMNLLALRSHLGIVSQEPNLFSKTIGENIAYGDNTRAVSKEEIISAAKNANIHNFITSLPLGYETKLGDKGTQLSGGQKQRVAIARALVRNPKVLLLDEATSALDAESEKVVQEALDNAKVGRTCISIAHRLTTIQDADVICVVNHGRVTEMGTHSELLNKRGLYYNLYSLQTR